MKRRTFIATGLTSGLVAVADPSGVGGAENKTVGSDSQIRAISTDRAPKPVGPFSQAIKANGFIFIAGQTARDPKTGQVIEGDITVQTERVMENLKIILEAAKSSLDRTVKTTVFLKNMDDFEEMGKVYSRYFSSRFPARSAVEVARLHAGRVEIELIALA